MVERFSDTLSVAEKVGAHEVGHLMAVILGGGRAHSVTTIPTAQYRGLTIGRPNPNNPLEHQMVVCAAGLAAEEMMGLDDHRGCGSDMAKLDYLAKVVSRFKYSGRISPRSLVAEAKSKARSWMSGVGQAFLRQEALKLAFKGTVIY